MVRSYGELVVILHAAAKAGDLLILVSRVCYHAATRTGPVSEDSKCINCLNLPDSTRHVFVLPYSAEVPSEAESSLEYP